MRIYSPEITGSLIVSGSIIPGTTDQYDLGSSTKRFKDLYLSGSTIFLGDIQLKDDDGKFVAVDSLGTTIPISGSLTGSLLGTSTTASYVDFSDIDNKPTLISSSAQIASDISGSFTSTSSSLSGRISTNENDISTLQGKTLISGSIQIDHDQTTNFVSNEHIDHSTVILTAGDGLSGGGDITTNRSFAVDSTVVRTSSSQSIGGVKTFTDDNQFTGTQYFDSIAVSGTGSFAYIQSVTGSAKIIGDAFIVLNANTPAERYAGIKVFDSGSTDTGSLQYDAVTNHWFYESTNEGYASVFLSGPTGSIGNLPEPTTNKVVKSLDGHHIGDSNITDNGTTITLGSNTEVSGDLNVGSGDFFVDDSTGRVGIGTTSPIANGLMIEKTGNHLFLRASSATAGKYWNFDVTSANQLYIINNAGTQYLTITDGGNVGIGTTSPAGIVGSGKTLAVYNTSHSTISVQAVDGVNDRNATLELLSSGNGGSTADIVFGDTDTTPSSASPLRFLGRHSGSTTERMRITSNGDVWIGNDTNPMLEIANGGSANVLSGIKFRIGSVRTDYGGIYTAASAPNNNYISFYTRSSISTVAERMRITSGGNVGIGTSSPPAKLSVEGVAVTVGDSNYHLSIADTASAAQGVGGGILFIGAYTGSTTTSGGFIQTEKSNATDGNFAFDLVLGSRANGSTPAERMRIDSSGNVGIGTASPSTLVQAVDDTNDSATFSSRWTASGFWSQLEVRNYSSNLNDQNSPQFKIMHNFNDGINNGYIGFHRGIDLGGGFLSFGSNGAERMRIDSSGNVGIGTTSPETLANYTFLTTNNATTGGGLVMQQGGTRKAAVYNAGDSLFYDSTSGHYFRTGGTLGGTTRMYIASGGNVGIGTDSPGVKLQVVETGAVPSTTIPFQTNNGGALFRVSLTSASSGNSLADLFSYSGGGGNTSSSAMSFSVRNAGTTTEAMRITSTGNVGIGTTSPGTKLDVYGSTVTNSRRVWTFFVSKNFSENTTGVNFFTINTFGGYIGSVRILLGSNNSATGGATVREYIARKGVYYGGDNGGYTQVAGDSTGNAYSYIDGVSIGSTSITFTCATTNNGTSTTATTWAEVTYISYQGGDVSITTH